MIQQPKRTTVAEEEVALLAETVVARTTQPARYKEKGATKRMSLIRTSGLSSELDCKATKVTPERGTTSNNPNRTTPPRTFPRRNVLQGTPKDKTWARVELSRSRVTFLAHWKMIKRGSKS